MVQMSENVGEDSPGLNVSILSGLKACRKCKSEFTIIWSPVLGLNLIGEAASKIPGVHLKFRSFRNGTSSWVNYCPNCNSYHFEDYIIWDVEKGRITQIKEIARIEVHLDCENCGEPIYQVVDRYTAICEKCAKPLFNYSEKEIKQLVLESNISELAEVLKVLSFERSLVSTGATTPDAAFDSVQGHIVNQIRKYREQLPSISANQHIDNYANGGASSSPDRDG